MSRRYALPAVKPCLVCGRPMTRKPGETPYLFARRELCSLTCKRRTVHTRASAGALAWTPEARLRRQLRASP